jgi:hypothetical protein
MFGKSEKAGKFQRGLYIATRVLVFGFKDTTRDS